MLSICLLAVPKTRSGGRSADACFNYDFKQGHSEETNKTYSISDTLNLSIFIKGMFVKTAFNVNFMYTRNVDDVEG